LTIVNFKLAGFSAGYILRVGIAAVLFILLFKWVAGKSRFTPLQAAAAAV
jgi:hypothetical protein